MKKMNQEEFFLASEIVATRKHSQHCSDSSMVAETEVYSLSMIWSLVPVCIALGMIP